MILLTMGNLGWPLRALARKFLNIWANCLRAAIFSSSGTSPYCWLFIAAFSVRLNVCWRCIHVFARFCRKRSDIAFQLSLMTRMEDKTIAISAVVNENLSPKSNCSSNHWPSVGGSVSGAVETREPWIVQVLRRFYDTYLIIMHTQIYSYTI